jgi:hypothetical protein
MPPRLTGLAILMVGREPMSSPLSEMLVVWAAHNGALPLPEADMGGCAGS